MDLMCCLVVAVRKVWAQSVLLGFVLLPLCCAAEGTGKVDTVMVARGAAYCSVVRLVDQDKSTRDGSLLLAFSKAGGSGVLIYSGRADGSHWHLLDSVAATTNRDGGEPPQWNPNLYVMKRASGGLPAGTVLLAANSGHWWGEHQRRHGAHEDLEVYMSGNGGRTWHYRGTVVKGGTKAGAKYKTGVWEPDVRVLGNGLMVVYYSSQLRYASGYNQLVAEKWSRDGGKHWSKARLVVAIPGGVERPGMPVVTQLPNGRYVMSYEDISTPHNGQVHLKFSKDGIHWGSPKDRGIAVETQSGRWPAGTPTVEWLRTRDTDGIIAVLAHHTGRGAPDQTIYWNNDLGQGPWWEAPAPVKRGTGNNRAGWTPALLRLTNGEILEVTSSSSPKAPNTPSANVILAAARRIDFNRYEAEDAATSRAVQLYGAHASLGRYMRVPAAPYGKLEFTVHVSGDSANKVLVRWKNVGLATSPEVSVDGRRLAGKVSTLHDRYVDHWRWSVSTFPVKLAKGNHEVVVRGVPHAINVDYVELLGSRRSLRK